MRRRLALLAATLLAFAAHADDVPSLNVKDEVVGKGPVATSGATVSVQYTGWLYDAKAKDHRGVRFDSSYDSGNPLSFTLGNGDVISGMDQGVTGMHVGGKRLITIPSRLGYGMQGAGGGDIPPNAALIFEVELLQTQ